MLCLFIIAAFTLTCIKLIGLKRKSCFFWWLMNHLKKREELYQGAFFIALGQIIQRLKLKCASRLILIQKIDRWAYLIAKDKLVPLFLSNLIYWLLKQMQIWFTSLSLFLLASLNLLIKVSSHWKNMSAEILANFSLMNIIVRRCRSLMLNSSINLSTVSCFLCSIILLKLLLGFCLLHSP